ncbi:MAG: efflux RND transporter periplasmic adaptor subunit [Akkermansiaceae bacterium]|nr:efflux RND transporter periplasmic adaptor subunit [Akkermansiaceae bacterium]
MVLLLAFAVALSSCGKPEEEEAGGGMMDQVQPVEVMPIELMTLTETTGLVGTVAANESAELRPEYPGVVESIHFTEGEAVDKDQLLIKIDTRELEAQLAETRAGFELAEKSLERTRKLLADRAVSELELDAAEAEYTRIQAVLERLEVQVAKSSIRAPFAGVVGERPVSVGDYVTPQDILTTVDDLSRLKVSMDVPERYLPLLQPGSTFQLSAATFGTDQTATGEVYFVSPRIDPQTRSTLVKGFVADPPEHLKPGMFANVTLVLRVVEDAMVVPEAAVLNTPKGTVLIKPEGPEGEQVAAFVPVQLGLRVPGYVQVTPVGPPLKPGDEIVSAGVGGLILFPGRKVKPVEPVVTPDKPSPEVTDRNLE